MNQSNCNVSFVLLMFLVPMYGVYLSLPFTKIFPI